MKVFVNNSVYVQKNDIGFLSTTDFVVPASIFLKVFGSGKLIIDDRNKYEFVRFDDAREVDFFRNVDWILDYGECRRLSEEEIIKMGKEIAQSKNNLARIFNGMSNEERKKNIIMVEECERLEFKMYSLRDFLWFCQGHIKMILPSGVKYPENIKLNNSRKLKKKRSNCNNSIAQ